MLLPDPPSSWNALDKEQLIFIHSLHRSEMEEPVYKLQVFLHLAGLELCGESQYDEPESTESNSLESIQKQLSWMESVLDGTAPVTVVLRPTKSPTPTLPVREVDSQAQTTPSDKHSLPHREGRDGAPLYSISDQDLFDAVIHFTKFLDDPYTLMAQPLGDIVIGSHTYKTPDPLFSNLTYEQFQNAQYALNRFWNYGQRMDEIAKQLKEDEEKHYKKQQQLAKMSGGNHKVREYTPDESLMQELETCGKEIKDAQAEFLVHTLTMLTPMVENEAVLDKTGKPSYTSRGIAKMRQVLHLVAPVVDVDAYSRRQTEEIRNNAPEYLFPILYQHFQSSMLEHKKKFPKLFSGKGGDASDAFVATVSTLNTLMHEQGYKDQQATLDANCVFNFQKLDELTRRAEEMERMNLEMKRKRK